MVRRLNLARPGNEPGTLPVWRDILRDFEEEAMGQRKTPRLAFWGEYVSPDTENSEEVYRARLELMRIVKRVLPQFLEKLSCDVFPLYEQLAKGGYDFDQILWTNSSPYTLLADDGGLKAVLSKWAAEFNAETEGLMDGALRTLRCWYVAPEWRESLKWDTIQASTSPPGIGRRFEFSFYGWETQLFTWAKYSELLRQSLKEKLLEYKKETGKLAESQGLVRARRKYSPENLEWFVLYQFAGMSSRKIADRCLRNGKGVDDSTVLKGVKAAAEMLGWEHLRAPRRHPNRKIR
jgi:hypothetical protein